ncbi:hypothetical protein ILYODFUR_026984 [Ilyodon furcidens]|uniref:Uncharacterized protein n=1 Tax=Ilyodon furcidens TaxID=33524 RepID=A0ABV0T1X1_9TELE
MTLFLPGCISGWTRCVSRRKACGTTGWSYSQEWVALETGPLTSGGSRLRLPDTEGVSQAARGLLTATEPAGSRLQSPDPASGAHREPPWRSPTMPLLCTEFRTDGFPGGSLLSGHVAPLRHRRPGFPLHTAPQQGPSSRAEFRGGARRAEASTGPNSQKKRFPSAPREGILH